MFYDNNKIGRGLIIGPVDKTNPTGDYYVFRISDFKIRKVHYYELVRQCQISVRFGSPENKRDKFLAFDNFNGNVLAVTSRDKKVYSGIILRSSHGDITGFPRFSFAATAFSRAPANFKVCLKNSIKFKYETQ